jgi:hypothetical protein
MRMFCVCSGSFAFVIHFTMSVTAVEMVMMDAHAATIILIKSCGESMIG